MPWKVEAVEDCRLRLVQALGHGVGSVAALCRSFGISRTTAYKWRERYLSEGHAGLSDRSRAPRLRPCSTGPEMCELLTELRLQHPTWGARKLRHWLMNNRPGLSLPAASTIHGILKSAGLIVKDRRRRRGNRPLVEGPHHGEGVWATDFKGQFKLGDGRYCFPWTLQDTTSRLLLACEAMLIPGYAHVKAGFEEVFKRHGLPLSIVSDNGQPFASPGAGQLTRLSVWFLRLGIVLRRIAPGHPEQNGRLERLHRTLKAEATRPPGDDIASQQRKFDAFLKEYNEERPHESLSGGTPASCFKGSKRAYTGTTSDPDYPGYYERLYVDVKGYVKFMGERRYLSEALRQEYVGAAETSDGVYSIYYFDHEIARYNERENEWWILTL